MYNQSILSNFTSSDYQASAIIEPPSDEMFLSGDTKKHRLIIDSRVRNLSVFPYQNKYDIEFDDNLDEVISCKMIYCDIPMPMYLVNSYFNKLVITINSIDYTVQLVNGNYNETNLATEIQTQLNALHIATFTVTYVALTDNFSFTCSTAFSMKFTGYPNPLNQLLGFGLKNYDSLVNTIQSEFRKNFEYNNYLIMDIEQFDVLKSTDKDLNKAFALIPTHYQKLNICDTFSYTKYFSPPLGKLARIKIRFYDKFGNLYDFQNMDHHFELLFESHKHKKKYGRFFNK